MHAAARSLFRIGEMWGELRTLDAAPSTVIPVAVAVTVLSRALTPPFIELAGSTVARAGACSHLDALCADAEPGMALAHGVARDGCSAQGRWARLFFAAGSECAPAKRRAYRDRWRCSPAKGSADQAQAVGLLRSGGI
jgi:hypothetical protein